MTLFFWSTIGREVHVICVLVPVLCDVTLLLFVVTVAGEIETICGNIKMARNMFPCTFCNEFLGYSFKRLLQHIKFIIATSRTFR